MQRELVPLALDPPLNITLVKDSHGLDLLEQFFARCGGVTGWDIETTLRKDYYWRKIRTIQFGNQTEQYLIDLKYFEHDLFSTQGNYGKDLSPGLQKVVECIRDAVCNRDILKVGINLGFEYHMFYWGLGLRTQHFFDCSIVERVIYAGAHGLKDFPFYGMEELMGRYFGFQIDKTLQESFDLESTLTWDQIEYACLDTRLPFAIKKIQDMILEGQYISDLPIDPLVMGDDLRRVAQLENDCIGAFQDMHVHGERIDRVAWMERVNARKESLRLVYEKLDEIFLPIVGTKRNMPTDEELDAADLKWKLLREITQAEMDIKAQIHTWRHKDPALALDLRQQKDRIQELRLEEKERHKAIHLEMRQRRNKIRDLAADCEGEALINYESGAQIKKLLNDMPVIREACGWSRKNNEYKKLEDMEDDTLEALGNIPVIVLLREKTKLTKEINTYGEAWVTEWVTGPSKDEGWLHPGDHKLHSNFNQYDAETGRSTSTQPNGQNLPKDPKLRACFIADPPDDEDDYVYVTADMSGAELRILAELANDPIWIEAFNRKADVHCVCCELMEPVLWPSLAEDDCAYYHQNQRKCKCAAHNTVRDAMKPTNFGLPYGIGPGSLSVQIKKTLAETKRLMAKHATTFPVIWDYLDEADNNAKERGKSFDMFGRRRIFPEPTWARAIMRAKENREEELRFPEAEAQHYLSNFVKIHGRKPKADEKWPLLHRQPTDREINWELQGLHSGIGRQGKNHEIQGTNASIAKIAMGCGYDDAGNPYLWHTLGQYRARLVKFVHDELVVHCPSRFGQLVADLIGDAFKRAAAEQMTKVVMEFEYHIKPYWAKG